MVSVVCGEIFHKLPYSPPSEIKMREILGRFVIDSTDTISLNGYCCSIVVVYPALALSRLTLVNVGFKRLINGNVWEENSALGMILIRPYW